MNAKLVEQLARLEVRGKSGIAQKATAVVQILSNPAFGWHIARAFARPRLPFPLTVIGRDHWLFQAYLVCLNPSAFHNSDVEAAYQVSQKPGISAKLKALLIAGLGAPIEPHLDLVADKAGIPRRTVEAFETLFFNVLDRHNDGLYLSEIAYPKGRSVEFEEDYFKTTPIPDLLLRAAYKYRDIDLMLRLAGMDDTSCVKELTALRDAETELEARIMGNALLLARTGRLNQRSVGIQRATVLLASSRTPANKANEPGREVHDIAAELAATLAAIPPISKADSQELQAASRPGRAYWSDDTGKVMALDEDDPESGEVLDHTEMFPEARPAIWKNKDMDMPVMIIGIMRSPGFPDYYRAESGTGLPKSEVFFEN